MNATFNMLVRCLHRPTNLIACLLILVCYRRCVLIRGGLSEWSPSACREMEFSSPSLKDVTSCSLTTGARKKVRVSQAYDLPEIRKMKLVSDFLISQGILVHCFIALNVKQVIELHKAEK